MMQLTAPHSSSGNALQFFFGVGSPYLPRGNSARKLAEETGAVFVWGAVYSPDLIARAGVDPFASGAKRGQYLPEDRTQDAQRWAALYGVPYSEPDWSAVDWRRLALACVAAERHGVGEAYARRLLSLCFSGLASPPTTDSQIVALAEQIGLAGPDFATSLNSPATEEQHEENLRHALTAGAFGVPTFVADDGSLFFGQDRLPLLRWHLRTSIRR